MTKESIAALSEEQRQELIRDWPYIVENLYEETVLAGFRKIDNIVIDGWCRDELDSGLGDWARERGISVQFTDCIRICEKQKIIVRSPRRVLYTLCSHVDEENMKAPPFFLNQRKEIRWGFHTLTRPSLR